MPATFQARIIRKRKYELNLLVYFTNKEERATVESLIGAYHSLNSVADPVSRMPTTVRIVVQDQDQRVLSDETIQSDGRLVTAARFKVDALGNHAAERRIATQVVADRARAKFSACMSRA